VRGLAVGPAAYLPGVVRLHVVNTDWTGSVDAELAKKGRSYVRNQSFPRSADCIVPDRAAPLESQEATAGCGFWTTGFATTNNVPALRIDHISAESQLPGMWQAPYRGGVFDL